MLDDILMCPESTKFCVIEITFVNIFIYLYEKVLLILVLIIMISDHILYRITRIIV